MRYLKYSLQIVSTKIQLQQLLDYKYFTKVKHKNVTIVTVFIENTLQLHRVQKRIVNYYRHVITS